MKSILILGLFLAGAAFGQNCGKMVPNPSTGKMDCLGPGPFKDANGNLSVGTTVLVSQVAATALAAGIASCAGSTSCLVDARSAIGNQTWTSNPFAGLEMPITLYTGGYTVTWNNSTFAVDVPSRLRWISAGTKIQSTYTATAGGAIPTDTAGRQYPVTAVLATRAYGTTGSIAASSPTLTVANAAHLEVGMSIAVVGAGGPELHQYTTLVGGINSSVTSLVVASITGLDSPATYSQWYLQIDNEIIQYTATSGTTISGLTRGVFGTAAASHSNGATVYALGNWYSRINAISGTSVTLADNATQTVSASLVDAGAIGVAIDGDLTIDGGYPDRTVTDTGTWQNGIVLTLASQAYIGPQVRLQNIAFAGVYPYGAIQSEIHGSYHHVGGQQSLPLGGDLFLWASSGNKIDTANHEDGKYFAYVDDHSNHYTRWDGPSNDNEIRIGPQIDLSTYPYYMGVTIEGGCSRNRASLLAVKTTYKDINVVASGQWTSDPSPTSNRVDYVQLLGTGASVNDVGATNTMIVGGVYAGAVALSATSSLISAGSASYLKSDFTVGSGTVGSIISPGQLNLYAGGSNKDVSLKSTGAGGFVLNYNNSATGGVDFYGGTATPKSGWTAEGAIYGTGGSAIKIVCWKTDGKTLGTATMSAGNISDCH